MTKYSRVAVQLTFRCNRTIVIPVAASSEYGEVHAAAFNEVCDLTPEVFELEFADLDVVDGPHELVLAEEGDAGSVYTSERAS